ncbi:MAG: hypothetical protein A2086_06210 [Spirochaetes bacterium GWD1_27_9]|nr:MAG: hypothetical protein A2Z98_16865 [Spirochaetes bacterium GWB1_27_13]OHD27848.1 MAG: hypothetical protein A2Y34_15605 [Spirochaetes bacterium GWC1_27_15]OHD30860.1 MAG: hypothetical protein A2086_06210 [Spirochaetes bacterium GWD1_27_9]
MKLRILFLIITFLSTIMIFSQNQKQLVIVFENYPPNTFIENNIPVGTELDIIKETLSLMNTTVEFKEFPWARCMAMVKNGDADGITPIFKTKERETFLFYPEEYTTYEINSLFKPKDSKIEYKGNLEEIKNYTICVKSETSYGEMFDKFKFLKKEIVSDQITIIKMVAGKRTDFGVGPVQVMTYMAKKDNYLSKIEFVTPELSKDPLFVAFSKAKDKNHELLAKEFSIKLKEFKKTDKYQKILKKYN